MKNRIFMFLCILCLAFTLFPSGAEAHAELVSVTPAMDAQLDQSPPSVEVIFNERLDRGNAELKVLNEASREVAGGKPEFIEEGKGLRISLPKLSEGHYTISFSVISADGHPISGAYVITIGNPAPLTNASDLDPHNQVGHSHNHGSSGLSTNTFLLYAARILYYAGLLSLAGLLLWRLQRNSPTQVKEVLAQALDLAGKFTLLAIFAYVFFSLQDLARGEPLADWGRILVETTIGRLYIVLLLLALFAPIIAKLPRWIQMLWVMCAVTVEAWSGHAVVFDPRAYTLVLDWLHILAASVWAGGLLLILALWRKDRPEASRFALLFSKWALISFLALWITGTLSTLKFLPSLEYLMYTSWGTWLLIKVGLSIAVAVVAFLIRLRLKKGDLPRIALLRVDIGLLCLILVSVGVLTYQTPLPANQPLNYHQMGTEMHVTLRVSPNSPGNNVFTLKIWLPDTDGEGVPKQVQLKMIPLSGKDVGAIDVPLEEVKDKELDAFPDFTKSMYRAEGPYLPFAGEWKAQIRVTDVNDNERVVEKEYRIY
ncbi:MAG: copper resistance protein CopC [Candidatus Cohnella colombiensis]|uniref:Copper resistance protein CopC n=1 Tax=Candidatus Cohnella colombiensis TaxID=3121368 RepID=A0AA95JGF9_9BACL|nr:MAG: copper resistance protein CopC [Cohnella sp.]